MNITLTMALKQLKYLVEDILFSNNNEIKNAITSNFHNYKKLEKLYINFRKVIELKYNQKNAYKKLHMMVGSYYEQKNSFHT